MMGHGVRVAAVTAEEGLPRVSEGTARQKGACKEGGVEVCTLPSHLAGVCG